MWVSSGLPVPPLTVKRVTRYSKTTRHPTMHRAYALLTCITSSHNPPRDRKIFSLVVKATFLIGGPGARPGHAPRPMGEPLRDIMAIFREAAAADKVGLHAVALRVYTHTGRRPADSDTGSRARTQYKSGYFDKSLANCYNSAVNYRPAAADKK